MLVIVRWVGRLFKKEYRFLERYERSHPHFIWFALADAVISVSLVLGGFQLYSHIHSTSAAEEKLERSGGVSLTESSFIEKVKLAGNPVYWLGPLSGSSYTFNDELGYLRIVTYIPSGSDVSQVAKHELIVETYASAKDLADHIHATANAGSQTSVTQSGMTIKYNAKDLTSMLIEISGVTQVVAVEYPKMQSEAQLLQDAGKLVLVK